MFAHQVIDDLRTFRDGYNPINVDLLIQFISEAHKFHFGEVDKLAVWDPKRTDIWELAKTYWNAPYDVCWFDFLVHGEETGAIFKVGYLLVREDENHNLMVFTGNNSHWLLTGCFTMVRKQNSECPYELYIGTLPYGSREAEEDSKCHCNEVLRLILLLHCKNTVPFKNIPPQKLNKKRIKRGKQPLFSYYTLQITSTAVNRNEKPRILGQGNNREHWCRGHFKHYSAEAPLFGKYQGLYFWEPHLRGDRRKGIIEKDYRYVPPKDDQE